MKRIKRERNEIKPRLMGTEELCEYLSLGRSKAYEIGKNAGAYRQIGKRVLFDVIAIDKYIDGMTGV